MSSARTPEGFPAPFLYENSAFLTEGRYNNYFVKLDFPELKVAAMARILHYVHSFGSSISRDGRRLMIHQGPTDQERLIFLG